MVERLLQTGKIGAFYLKEVIDAELCTLSDRLLQNLGASKGKL